MSTSNLRLSVPAVRKTPPRPLTGPELATFVAITDVLCPGDQDVASASAQPEFPAKLDLALATRRDAFDRVMGLLAEAADLTPDPRAVEAWLRAMDLERPEDFQALSTIAAGAYLLLPPVRAAIGYAGQRRELAGIEEAADEISDGILDPVLERGHFYVAPPED